MESPSSVKSLLLQLEGALSQYSSLTDSPTTIDATHARSLESRIESLITQTASALQQLSSSPAASAPADAAVLRSQRSRLGTVSDEYRRCKRSVTEAIERAALLSGSTREESSDTVVAVDELLRERGCIDASTGVANETVDIALATHATLEAQRARMQTATGSAGGISSLVGRAQGLISKISEKKKRNTFVLGLTIALCLCFLFWWWTSSK